MKKAFFTLFVILLSLLFTLSVYAHEDGKYDEPFDFGKTVLISAVIGLIIGFIAVSLMKVQLKSVRYAKNAANYIREGSFCLTESRDVFLYSTVARVPKPQSNEKKVIKTKAL